MRTERILILFHPERSISIVTSSHKIFALLDLFRNFLWIYWSPNQTNQTNKTKAFYNLHVSANDTNVFLLHWHSESLLVLNLFSHRLLPELMYFNTVAQILSSDWTALSSWFLPGPDIRFCPLSLSFCSHFFLSSQFFLSICTALI